MANTKISAMTAASTLAGTEKWPGVQSGANVAATTQQLSTYMIGATAGAGTPVVSLTGGLVLGQITGTSSAFAEFDFQNSMAGATASTDIIVNADNATATTNYGNLGINSSTFTGTGSLNLAGATYLAATTGDLVLGTTTANKIRLVTNGAATDAIQIASGGAISLLNAVTSAASITFTAATAGIVLKQGSNGLCGTFTANGTSTVAVSNTNVAITDGIIISLNTAGGTVGVVPPTFVSITAGTGFSIKAQTLDTSTYNYSIIKNAP